MSAGTNNSMNRGKADAVVQAQSINDVSIRTSTVHNHGVFAVSGVVVLLICASVYVWTSTHKPEPGVAAVAAVSVKNRCESGWIVPEQSGPIPVSDRPSGAVLASGGAVTVTVQGLTGDAVVLQQLSIEVVSRKAAVPGMLLKAPCGSDVPTRYFTVDLGRPRPVAAPAEGTKDFPYQVSGTDPEQLLITPVTENDDVEWRLRIPWTSGSTTGELVIDDEGKPLRTTATSATRPFCVEQPDGLRWVSC
jgi:hypothetical protein